MARSLLYRCRILQVSDVHNLFLTGVRCSYCASVGCSFLAAVNCQYLPSFAEIVQPFLCTQTVCFPPNVQFLSSGNRTCKNKERRKSRKFHEKLLQRTPHYSPSGLGSDCLEGDLHTMCIHMQEQTMFTKLLYSET